MSPSIGMVSPPVEHEFGTWYLSMAVSHMMIQASYLTPAQTRQYMRQRMVAKMRKAGAEGAIRWHVENEPDYMRIEAYCGRDAARWVQLRRAYRRRSTDIEGVPEPSVTLETPPMPPQTAVGEESQP